MQFTIFRKSVRAGAPTRKHFTWWSLPILVIWIGIEQTQVLEASTFDGDEWSAWSSWTPCSRTCDGGITQQFRRCKSPNGCHGVSIRRKMCNMQPCIERRDYRNEQCKAFNGREYKGFRRQWEAVEDPEYPCASTCRAEGTNMIAKLSPKLKDGTLCRPGTLHVCVDGRCEPVGCDLKLGSPKTVDECGVCGGDGSSCTTQIYRWAVIPDGLCSTTCGGGHQSVKVICRNSLTEGKVEQFLCNSAQKPYRIFQNCNIQPCQPEWQTGEWVSCSVKCGGGLRIRRVFCAQEKNASKIQVAEKHCQHIQKPANQEQCNMEPCPSFHVGPWSLCSTTCGTEGVRTRNVVCRDAHNLPSSMCDLRLLPASSKACEDSPPCPTFPTTTTSTAPNPPTTDSITLTSSDSASESEPKESEYFEEELPFEYTLPLIQPYPPMDNAVMFDRNAIPSEPTKVRVNFACGWFFQNFVAENWGPCSQTCGEGIRKREVNCKIFLEFTRTIANLPDKECPGPKPPETESCFARPCPVSTDKGSTGLESLSDSHHAALADSDSNSYRKTVGIGLSPGIALQDMTFSWKVDGYTPCSASCLGGVQERRIACVRDYDQRAATPVLCMDKPRPDIPTTRTCNDHPCPPRWNVSDFGHCSKPCGGGVMTRDVSCIHEVTRGNTVTVPNNQCPQPVPRTERFCNAINCPPFWEAGDWDRCSKPCGGGVRSRQLACKQIIALGQIVDRSPPETHCTQPQPSVTRPCNNKPCSREKDANQPGQPASPNDANWPNIIQNEWKRKVSLTVRGQATVYKGITLKLRCPASKSIDRGRLVWMKDYHYVNLQPSKIEIIPKSGVLKIKNTTFSDSAVYTCLVNDRAISNLTLMVQPFPGDNERNIDIKPNRNRQNIIEETNKIAVKPRGSTHDGTLYADQQPGVSVIPVFDSDGGLESRLITPNTKLYSGSTSGASYIQTPFSCFLHGVAWVLWPLRKIIRLKEQEYSVFEDKSAELLKYNGFQEHSEELHSLENSFSSSSKEENFNCINGLPIRNSKRRNNFRHSKVGNKSRQLERVRRNICFNSSRVKPSPVWIAGAWSKCSEINCFTWNTSNRRRIVFCGLSNKSESKIMDQECDPSDKPTDSEECYNKNCRGIWRTESWSQCKSMCGAIGFKTRILKCVWFGSESPAGNACQVLPRPIVKKACRGSRCSKSEDSDGIRIGHVCVGVSAENTKSYANCIFR